MSLMKKLMFTGVLLLNSFVSSASESVVLEKKPIIYFEEESMLFVQVVKDRRTFGFEKCKSTSAKSFTALEECSYVYPPIIPLELMSTFNSIFEESYKERIRRAQKTQNRLQDLSLLLTGAFAATSVASVIRKSPVAGVMSFGGMLISALSYFKTGYNEIFFESLLYEEFPDLNAAQAQEISDIFAIGLEGSIKEAGNQLVPVM